MKTKLILIITLSLFFYNVNSQTQLWKTGTNVLYNYPLTTKIGIGLTTPNYLLHLNGGDFKIGNSSGAFTNTNRLLFGDGEYIQIGEMLNDDQLVFKAKSHIFMPSSSFNGWVGIGTTTLSAPLTVKGFVYSNGLTLDSKQAADWSYGLCIKVDRDLTKAIGIISKSGEEVFRVYGNGIMYAKKIEATEFEIRPDASSISWYDHVFSDDYKLKSIQEVEKYILTNKHLPEIPSEKKINENGYKMVEMDGLLLMKIEELTLYIIEQQKQIEELKKIVQTNK